ncbi:MAG: ABC transporter ATP-binding protein [Verrucomicrobiota bacterium]|nr:ABC transporter ATP-binding protein [Verrucomicrobiota bacterium]
MSDPIKATTPPKGSKIRHDLSLARVDKRLREEDEPHQRPLDLGIIKRLLTYMRPYAGKRNWLIVCTIARSIQLPLIAWALGSVIKGPIASGDGRGIALGAMGFGLLVLITQVTMHFRQRLALELGESIVRDIRNQIYNHLMRHQMSYFNRTKLGRIISRLTSDVDALRGGVQNVLFVCIVQIGQMLGAASLMIYYNWRLFLVILTMAPTIYFINRHFRKRLSAASREVQESFSRVTASIVETVKGIRVTQGYVREEVNAGLFRRLIADHAGYNMGLSRQQALYIPLLDLNSQFFLASILFIGGYGALHPEWRMPVGDLITFFFLSDLFFSPISSLGHQFSQALTAMAGAERVFKVLDTPPDWTDSAEAKEMPQIMGQVDFSDVYFHYLPDKPVLQAINFSAKPGQSIAFVGHTGSGKTTIINLLSKFYIPQKGTIRIDGQDIANVTSDSLHRQMGIVLQQNFLFAGTVLENIRLGRLNATDEEVIDAVRKLDCLDVFDNMSKGIMTEVGERGTGLSVGQQQLVCFARAMLANPRILILDEATSAIDTVTEARLQKALAILLKGRTSFIVAHRLSTIRNADTVLVLDHGIIVERGNHAELLILDGTYARLYRQFAAAVTDEGVA